MGNFQWPKNVRLSADCKSFIKCILDPDWRRRADADTALKHKWLRQMEVGDRLDGRLMEKVRSAGKLQKLLVHSVLQEMDDGEKTALLQRMESRHKMECPQKVTAYILNHRLSTYQCPQSSKQNELGQLANDHTLFIRDGIDEEASDHVHDGLLEDLMDEVEVDFEDYDFDDSTLEDMCNLELLSTSMSSAKSLSHSQSKDVSIDGIPVSVFKRILTKSAKRESINLDGIVDVLDPDRSGIIHLSSIHTFGHELSDYKVVESQSSGLDDVAGHHDQSVHIKSPMELRRRQTEEESLQIPRATHSQPEPAHSEQRRIEKQRGYPGAD